MFFQHRIEVFIVGQSTIDQNAALSNVPRQSFTKPKPGICFSCPLRLAASGYCVSVDVSHLTKEHFCKSLISGASAIYSLRLRFIRCQ